MAPLDLSRHESGLFRIISIRQQTKIKQDEERMKSDGKLTKQKRKKFTREQNRASNNIYNKKHNDKKANVSQ